MDQINSQDVLYAFAQYGFQKTSMSDIARAAGVSRQSIYNNFGSKDAIFNYVIRDCVQMLYDGAMTALHNEAIPAKERLIETFTVWTGSNIPLLHDTPHGAELTDKAIQTHMKESVDIEEKFTAEIATFIATHKLINDAEEQIDDIVYTILMASKGLMLKVTTIDHFKEGMTRIIHAIL